MASIQKKLNQWLDAGVISQTQFETIHQFEDEQGSGWSWVHTFILLGAAIIGLGIISIIAANWSEIPDHIKLGADFALLGLLAIGIFFTSTHKNSVWSDGLVTTFIILCLASIGLISQIYHQGGEWYYALLFWALITLPIVLFTHHLIPSFIWVVLAIPAISVSLHQVVYGDIPFDHEQLLPLTGVLFLVLLHQLSHWHTLAQRININLFFCFQVSAILALIIIDLMRTFNEIDIEYTIHPVIYGLIFLTALSIVFNPNYKTLNRVLLLSVLALFIAYFEPTLLFNEQTYFDYLWRETENVSLWQGDDFRAAVLTLTILFLYALHAGNCGYRNSFNIVTLLIGVRFILLYFQAFGGLAATGIGLIISGSVIIAMTWIWLKSRHHLQQWARGLNNHA